MMRNTWSADDLLHRATTNGKRTGCAQPGEAGSHQKGEKKVRTMLGRDAGRQQLVIFDFDGTLADTWDWLAEEVVAGASKLGYRSVSRDELESLRAFSTREVFKKLGISWWRMPQVAQYLRSRAEARRIEIRLFDGASELVEAVHAAGSDIALVSSNSAPVIRHVLGMRLMPLVKLMDCGGAVFGKASKLRRVLRKCGTTPQHAVFVGDETRDLDAADAAGIRGLGVEWGYAAPELLRRAAPGRTAGDMQDLRRMLVATSNVPEMPSTMRDPA